MNIKIKQIEAQETYSLRNKVMWPDKPLEFIKLEKDKEGLHFGLLKNSEIISVVSLFIEGTNAQFRKLATKTSEQCHGYGTLLLQHVINYVVNEKGIDNLWCNARVDKTAFYKRFGMTETDKRFTKAGVNYVIMKK